ncbi:hypothetical protein ACWFR5_42800 [Streptomyces sp. NPDC055092]
MAYSWHDDGQPVTPMRVASSIMLSVAADTFFGQTLTPASTTVPD